MPWTLPLTALLLAAGALPEGAGASRASLGPPPPLAAEQAEASGGTALRAAASRTDLSRAAEACSGFALSAPSLTVEVAFELPRPPLVLRLPEGPAAPCTRRPAAPMLPLPEALTLSFPEMPASWPGAVAAQAFSAGVGEEEPAAPEPEGRRLARFDAPAAQGGYESLVLGSTRRFRTGPELAWIAPDPPAEELVDTSVLMPAWAVWYSPSHFRWAIGLCTGSRFVVTDYASTLVDPFTSVAKLEVRLP